MSDSGSGASGRARPNRCRQFRDLLSARIDDELTDEDKARLDAHLTHCGDCTSYADTLDSLDLVIPMTLVRGGSLASRSVEDLSGLTDQVRRASAERLRDTKWRAHRRRRITVRLAVAAVPLGLSVAFLSSGAFAHAQVHPTHPKTPCTHLLAAPLDHVGPGSPSPGSPSPGSPSARHAG